MSTTAPEEAASMPEQRAEQHGDKDERIEELEGTVAELYDHMKNFGDRLRVVEDENETLQTAVEDRNQRIAALEQQLESIADLGEKAQSTPEARARDLRILLSNKAKAKAEKDDLGAVQWTYTQVQDALESHGHGNVYPHQCYTAMEDAADADGFAHTENEDGHDVIRASWSKITADVAVIQNNNAKGVGPAASSTKHTVESKSD